MKKHPKHLSLQDLPLTLSAAHLAEIPGISQGTVYSLMKQPDFPLIQFGKRMLVSRERFFEWLERRTQHLEEDGTYGTQSWNASGEHQETHRRPL